VTVYGATGSNRTYSRRSISSSKAKTPITTAPREDGEDSVRTVARFSFSGARERFSSK
jgi:hypothetical protein